MSEHTFNIETVSLDEIKITQASLENRMTSDTNIDIKSLELSYGFEAGINIDKRLVRVTFECGIFSPQKVNEEPIVSGHFKIDFLFKVPELEQLSYKSESQSFIRSNVLVSLANICYSTARGIIYNRCLGTTLDGFMLPILPTTKLYEFFPPAK